MNPYVKYERMKAEWIAANPDATAREYEAAMSLIAKSCGV